MSYDEPIDMNKYFTLFEQFKKDGEVEIKDAFDLNSRVLIIDVLNMFIRSWCGSPAMNDDGEHIGGITGFLYSMGNAIRITQATHCILVSDGEGGSARRRKIYPDYKNQSRAKSINRAYDFKNKEEEEKAMQRQLVRLIQYLKQLPIQVITIEHTEADDIIAYLAQEVYNKDNQKVTIVSSDKDFLQLVTDRINVWSPTKKIMYTPAKVFEEYGIPPENFLLFRMLDGDPSDNIPGVKGTGLKTMKKYLPMVTENRQCSIEEILEHAEKENSGKSKKAFYTHVVESKDTLYLNQKLMQLESPPISASAKMKVTELVTGEIPTLNKYEIHVMYIHDKLSSAIPNIEEWLLKTFNVLNSFSLNNKK